MSNSRINSGGVESWSECHAKDLKSIRGICLDIDDTLSTSGKLTAEAFASLWALHKAGFVVVPVTGRPAGWCDHIARFWPVHAVVGENGAFTFFMKDGKLRRIDTLGTTANPDDLKKKLTMLRETILEQFPDAQWASDQAYREYDLAVDTCEDVAPWPREKVDALLDLCRKNGAHAKLSSIHVNIWYGEYDKLTGFHSWLKHGAPGSGGQKWDPKLTSWIYVGDSPNDEPMFKAFPTSVGVANLRKYLDQIQHKPTWITSEESGKGFSQLADKLLA